MGKLIMGISGVALFIVDLLSLYAFNLEYGLSAALAAFFIVPAQFFVPFFVGTWPIALALTALFFIGLLIDSRKD
jgi:hypothetical protein